MWNSFSTAGPLGLTAQIVPFIGGGGDEINAYHARPDTDEPVPGLVLIHHMPGWDEYTQEFAERLARHGFEVICPNLYYRYGLGTPDEVAKVVRDDGGIHDDSVVADCAAALDWLRAQPGHSGRAGIIGQCSGGRHAVLVASLVQGFDAVVDMWGGRVAIAPEEATPQRPVAPIEYVDRMNAPLLGLFGNDDQTPSPEQVDAHEAALKAASKDYEFHRFDGAGHAFASYHGASYRPQQADRKSVV